MRKGGPIHKDSRAVSDIPSPLPPRGGGGVTSSRTVEQQLMADEYVYFLFNNLGQHIETSTRRPGVPAGFKCLAVFADRLIIGAQPK